MQAKWEARRMLLRGVSLVRLEGAPGAGTGQSVSVFQQAAIDRESPAGAGGSPLSSGARGSQANAENGSARQGARSIIQGSCTRRARRA